MDIAIPRAGHPDEQRVALTPAGVQELAADGHAVYVECGAGLGAGFADNDYGAAGARIVYSPAEIYGRGQLLITVDGISDNALQFLRPGQIVCGFLLLAVVRRRMLAALAAARVSTLSYELIQRASGATGAGAHERDRRPAAAAARGALSRIVPTLELGAGVVTSRYDVHSVITEYGAAQLYGKTLVQRAQALIAITHPDFRDMLAAAARKLSYL